MPRRARISTVSSRHAFLEQIPSHPGVTCLSLNRPGSKNAISRQMLQEIETSLETVSFDNSVRVLIVRSTSPDAFCAGADLIERRSMTPVQVSKFLDDLRSTLDLLEALPMPTIAAIDGPALGGGLELSLACDLRVAGHHVTKIGLPETKLGIIPGAGGTQRTARLIGLSKAKDLIFTARMLTASEALDWGISTGHGFDRALSLAKSISANAPLALRAAKRAISFSEDLPLGKGKLSTGLDFERVAYDPLLKTADRREALEAFKEKRSPVFKGE
ncbi:ClpP/crotonase-like domain-containing protein [Mucidula mucida]|nr:ClpP/crotonase-like domain-containing protein [Mucidula mucida]